MRCSPTARSCAPISVIRVLEIRALSVSYGLHQVLDDVSLEVAPGEIVVMLGANGAGKTTLLKAVGGIVRPRAGSEISLDGVSLIGLALHEIVEAGIALVPEGRGIFGDLAVAENLTLGAFARRPGRQVDVVGDADAAESAAPAGVVAPRLEPVPVGERHDLLHAGREVA